MSPTEMHTTLIARYGITVRSFGLRVLGLVAMLMVAPAGFADDRRDNSDMIRLMQPLTDAVADSVVQVLSGNRPVALGTVVSADGYLLTKRSELSGDPIRVRLGDGRLFPARVAAVRRRNDLALLRIEADVQLPPIKFTPTAAENASFLVSPGRTGRPIGIGVVGVPSRPIEHHGRLGVMLDDDPTGRALVRLVFPNSGAEDAGIEQGDLIVAVNGRQERSRVTVIETLRGIFPGESVRLTILRKGDAQTLETLEMDAWIHELGLMQETENDSKVNGPRSTRLSGFDSVIQHDTVLDPDECGGPVLDTSGRVIGLNIARAGRVVSYALPASLVTSEMISMLEEARAAAR